MSSTCQDKEAAWEFLRETLLPKYEEPEAMYHVHTDELKKHRFRVRIKRHGRGTLGHGGKGLPEVLTYVLMEPLSIQLLDALYGLDGKAALVGYRQYCSQNHQTAGPPPPSLYDTHAGDRV